MPGPAARRSRRSANPMADRPLTLSVIPSPLTQPVIDGRVPVEGAALAARGAASVNANSMEMLDLAYDVAEMSFATYTKAREQGVALVGLPLFTGRRFLQGATTVALSSGIHDASQLRGKRIGLPQFWMTSSVWHRLVLRQVYGIAQDQVSWVTAAPERMGSLGLPSEAHLDTSGRTPRDMLIAGEIDAIMGPGVGGPRGEGGERDDRVVRMEQDVPAAQRAYYEKTGVFPIMHLIVMKEELADREPWLVESLCNAFERAKDMAREEPAEGHGGPISGLSAEENRALFGDDPWCYGIAPSRKVLETFLADVRDQGLIDRPMAPEELFAKNLPAAYR